MFKTLALGLYHLPLGWRRGANRRPNLVAILASLIGLNLLTARAYVQEYLINGGRLIDAPYATIVWALVPIWLIMYFMIITDSVYRDIEGTSAEDSASKRASSIFIAYFVATVLLFFSGLWVIAPD